MKICRYLPFCSTHSKQEELMLASEADAFKGRKTNGIMKFREMGKCVRQKWANIIRDIKDTVGRISPWIHGRVTHLTSPTKNFNTCFFFMFVILCTSENIKWTRNRKAASIEICTHVSQLLTIEERKGHTLILTPEFLSQINHES